VYANPRSSLQKLLKLSHNQSSSACVLFPSHLRPPFDPSPLSVTIRHRSLTQNHPPLRLSVVRMPLYPHFPPFSTLRHHRRSVRPRSAR
jgi:hypothetical protein